jgi:hypothetical protein
MAQIHHDTVPDLVARIWCHQEISGSKTRMQYDVRFQIGGEERTELVEAESAAEAARQVQEKFLGSDEVFELIQVHLVDEVADGVTSES